MKSTETALNLKDC